MGQNQSSKLEQVRTGKRSGTPFDGDTLGVRSFETTEKDRFQRKFVIDSADHRKEIVVQPIKNAIDLNSFAQVTVAQAAEDWQYREPRTLEEGRSDTNDTIHPPRKMLVKDGDNSLLSQRIGNLSIWDTPKSGNRVKKSKRIVHARSRVRGSKSPIPPPIDQQPGLAEKNVEIGDKIEFMISNPQNPSFSSQPIAETGSATIVDSTKENIIRQQVERDITELNQRHYSHYRQLNENYAAKMSSQARKVDPNELEKLFSNSIEIVGGLETKLNYTEKPILVPKLKKPKSIEKSAAVTSVTSPSNDSKSPSNASQRLVNPLPGGKTTIEQMDSREDRSGNTFNPPELNPNEDLELRMMKIMQSVKEKTRMVNELFVCYQKRKNKVISFAASRKKGVSESETKSHIALLESMDKKIQKIQSQLEEIKDFSKLKTGTDDERRRLIHDLQVTIFENSGITPEQLEEFVDSEISKVGPKSQQKPNVNNTKEVEKAKSAEILDKKMSAIKRVRMARYHKKMPLSFPSVNLSEDLEPPALEPVDSIQKSTKMSPVKYVKNVANKMAKVVTKKPSKNTIVEPAPVPPATLPVKRKSRVRLGQTKAQFEKSLKTWSQFHLSRPPKNILIEENNICFMCEYSLFFFEQQRLAKLEEEKRQLDVD